MCRQNQELEKLNALIQVEKLRLEQQNTTLAQNLAAVVQEKLVPDVQFNLSTPIDETLSVLHSLIMVTQLLPHVGVHSVCHCSSCLPLEAATKRQRLLLEAATERLCVI